MSIIKATPHIKSDVVKHHLDFRTRGRLTEKYDLDWMKGIKSESCNTGYWKHDASSDRHIIRISPLAYDTIATDKTKRIQVPELFRHVYEHEAAHSLYTDKDLKGLAAILAADKIPWRLLNLFEDCRIERKWLYLERKASRWNWLKWDKRPEPADIGKVSAQMLLYRYKCESVKRSVPRDFQVLLGKLPFYSRVWDYYTRIVIASDTRALIPILKDWLKEFPSSGDDTIEEEGGLGTGDLGNAIKEDTGKEPGNVKATNPTGKGASPEKHKGDDGKSEESKGSSGKDGTTKVDGATGYGSEGDTTEAFDGESLPTDPAELREFKLSHRLAAMLDTAFKARGDGREFTSNPSKKLNVRGILRGDFLRPYVGKSQSDKGKAHVSILVDCSGSMSHMAFVDRDRKEHIRCDVAGRVLLRALNILTKRGRISCIAYATSAGGMRARVPFPVKDAVVFGQFYAHSSSEGMGKALDPMIKGKRSVFNEVVGNGRLVICYTDGCIGDAPVNRQPLRARGVHTLGVCCSSTDTTERLKDHFDSPIWRESLWGMADALVRQLKALPTR